MPDWYMLRRAILLVSPVIVSGAQTTQPAHAEAANGGPAALYGQQGLATGAPRLLS